jgi:hypothetical protein
MKKPSTKVVSLTQWRSDYIYKFIVDLFKQNYSKWNEAKKL